MSRKEIDRFDCVDEIGGTYVVIEYETQVLHKPVAGAKKALGGSLSWFLEDGSSVNRLDNDRYKIVETDEIIHRER